MGESFTHCWGEKLLNNIWQQLNIVQLGQIVKNGDFFFTFQQAEMKFWS